MRTLLLAVFTIAILLPQAGLAQQCDTSKARQVAFDHLKEKAMRSSVGDGHVELRRMMLPAFPSRTCINDDPADMADCREWAYPIGYTYDVYFDLAVHTIVGRVVINSSCQVQKRGAWGTTVSEVSLD